MINACKVPVSHRRLVRTPDAIELVRLFRLQRKGEAMMKAFMRQLMLSAGIGLFAAIGGHADAGTITFDTEPTGPFSSFTESGYTVIAIPATPVTHRRFRMWGGLTRTFSLMAIRATSLAH